MQQAQVPAKFPIPFADEAGAGYIRQIPRGSQVGIVDGAASLETGFPPLNFLPIDSGGVPPFGQDMQGILKQITQWSRWQAAGATNLFDQAFATAIGGYPRGAVLASTTPGLLWLSTADNNATNPDSGSNAANWLAIMTDAAIPSTSLVRAGADVSTTANQIVVPVLTPSLNALQNYQVFEIVPNVSITGAATIRLGSYGAVPLRRRDGGELQNGDGPAGQPFLGAFLNGVVRSLDMRRSEIAEAATTSSNAQYFIQQFYQTLGTYWRLDSPSTVIPANTQTVLANYANRNATVGSGTDVSALSGVVTIGPNDAGVYVLTATNAVDIPTTEETIVLFKGNASNPLASSIAISRGPYPDSGNNANDKSVTAVIRLAAGDKVSAVYIQNNPGNSPANSLNAPLGHFGGVRVSG